MPTSTLRTLRAQNVENRRTEPFEGNAGGRPEPSSPKVRGFCFRFSRLGALRGDVTRRAREAFRSRRPISFLALVGSLTLLALGQASQADAASLVAPYAPGGDTTSTTVPAPGPAPTVLEITTTTTIEVSPPEHPVMTTTPVPDDVRVTGSGSRVVVRIGSWFFALGGIVSYVASGTRRRS